MAQIELDNEVIVRQRQALEAALTSNPDTEKVLRKVIAAELQKARKALSQAAKGNMKSDPREAYKAVRRSVYKRVLGGNLNILNPRRAGAGKAWPPERKLDQNPNQRGGNRRKRSARTEQIDGYWGADRGFILRFVNSGTDDRLTRYGNRGRITPRNWFGSASQNEMESAAGRLGQIIDNELEKILQNG